jgi:hypothetical protein
MTAMAERPACQRGVEVPQPRVDSANDPKSAEDLVKSGRSILQR